MPNNKRILIHVGPGKTGTSAIQSSLLLNKGFLRNSGVYYPSHMINKNGISSGNMTSLLSYDEHRQLFISRDKVSKLVKWFYGSSYDVLLLSSEFFFDFIEELSDVVPSAEFLIYIRNPLEIIDSGYNQAVKRHRQTAKLSVSRSTKFRQIDGFEKIVKKISASRLNFRFYDRAIFVGGDIVSDFYSVLGLERSSTSDNQRINTSYCFEALEYKRALNNLGLDEIEPTLDSTLQGMESDGEGYSLIEPDTYEELRQAVITRLKRWQLEYDEIDLERFTNSVLNARQKRYFSQHNTHMDFRRINNYIKKHNIFLYLYIKRLLAINNDLVVDRLDIYSSYGLSHCEVDADRSAINETSQFLSSLNLPTGKQVLLAVDYAKILESRGKYEQALLFYRVAYGIRPDMKLVYDPLNRLIVMNNQKLLKPRVKLELYIYRMFMQWVNAFGLLRKNFFSLFK
ncbi:hypothetical protein [Shewanella waksmanii]|uniref:hypothetical protein n=1 Tax=Shewanella waksmanii TaxID=213783 RepID=UPI0037358316